MSQEAKYLLPLKGVVAFPGNVISFQISDKDLASCLLSSWELVLAPYKDDRIGQVGCLCELMQVYRAKEDTVFILRGTKRVRVEVGERLSSGCYAIKEVQELEEVDPPPEVEEALKTRLLELTWKYNPNLAELLEKLRRFLPLSQLTDQIAFITPINPRAKVELLEELDVQRRAEMLIEMLEEMLREWPVRFYRLRAPQVRSFDRWVKVNLN